MRMSFAASLHTQIPHKNSLKKRRCMSEDDADEASSFVAWVRSGSSREAEQAAEPAHTAAGLGTQINALAGTVDGAADVRTLSDLADGVVLCDILHVMCDTARAAWRAGD